MRRDGFDEFTARNRGVRLLSETLDQLQTKSPFQFTYLQADRRLRQVEPTRRRGETAALDHFEKGPQLVEAEAPHSKISLSK